MIIDSQIPQGFVDNNFSVVSESRAKAQIDDFSLLVHRARNKGDVEKTAKDFEAVFITQMVQHMFAGIEPDPLFGGGNAEDVFKTFLFDEYGKAVSKAGGIGIASNVARELLKTQEIVQ